MVHALSEIRRGLVKSGIMIDVRPIMDRWPVEVVSGRGARETGRMHDLPSGIEEDQAANRSLIDAEENGWFVREAEDLFPFVYVWDTPREMEEWIETEWHDFIQLDQQIRQTTRSAWASADADARVQIAVKMLITRWKVARGL